MATKVVTLLSATSVTSTQTGSTIPMSIVTKPITTDMDGATDRLAVGVYVTVAAGDGTVTPSVQGKFGSNWITLTPSSAYVAAATLTDGTVYRTYVGPIPNEIRGLATLSGSATFSCTMTAIGVI